MLDLCRIKEDFSVLVKEAQPWTLTQFVMWLDLKLSEFKIKGYMVLDHHTKTKPKWIAEEDTTSDVAPIPPTCRQCHKPTNDGNFYSDLHASPSSHRTVVHRPQQPMEDSESVRGEVGIIDLSHAVNVRRDSPAIQRPQESEIRAKNYQTLFREKSSNVQIERDKGRKDDVIEIDGSSPTEKMFITSANKTSTPVTTNTRPVVKKQKIRPSLSMGTAIYTSTTSVTTPTFSSSYMSSPSRNTMPSLSNRKYALGAPPVSVPSNLDEMIAQAVQFNEIRTDQSLQSQSHSVQANRTDQSLQSQSPLVQANITDIRSIQQQPKLQELVQASFTVKSPVQTSFTVKSPVQTSFTEQHIVQSNINEPTVSLFPQTSASSSAVPVALHANIDNISRDISQNSAHSSSDTMEIKIESEVDNSLGDSFFVGESSQQTLLMEGDTTALSHDMTQTFSSLTTGELPKQGLVDPDTARAFQMVELVNGSGVYVYDRTISQAFKVGTEHQTGTYSGEKMARYLLNVFWSRKELVGATLSKAGRGKKILNQRIIEAILDFCTTNGYHSKAKVRQVLGSCVSAVTSRERQRNERLRTWNLKGHV